MRFALFATSGLLLAGAAFLVYASPGAAPATPAAPAVTIEPAVHDFGSVSRDRVEVATFLVANTHPVAVTAGPISRGCSCSEAVLTPATIPPGGTAELTLTWTLRNKRGASSEAVSVPYAGPGGVAGSLHARLRANVHGAVDPDVDVLELTTANKQGEVRYSSKLGRTFRITGATTSHASLTATVQPDGRGVQVTFDPAKPGWESGQLILVATTDQPGEPDVRVWVRVTKVSAHDKE